MALPPQPAPKFSKKAIATAIVAALIAAISVFYPEAAGPVGQLLTQIVSAMVPQ